jgi:opacity protein-like surface antigen
MRIRLWSLGLFAWLVSPIAAFGADLPAPSPPPVVYAPPSNWSGFYAGAFVGGLDGSFSTSQATRASGSGFGVSSGVLAGYAFQSGSLVYGVEGDIASMSFDKKFGAQPGLVANEIEGVYELHARARLGWDLGDWLPFIAGGAAIDHIYQHQTSPNDFLGAAQDRVGWTIGAGVDAKVSLPILGATILRAEYLFEELPNATYVLGGPALRTSLGVNEVRLALITPIGAGWQPSPEVVSADWSGSFFGVLGGGAVQTITTKGLGASDSFNASGGFGGVYSGRNYMFGNAMAGFDGALTLGDVEGNGAQPGAPATHYRDYFDADIRARAGYAFGRFLPYVAAGLAWNDSEQTDTANGNFRDALSDFSGIVGVGLEYMASDRITIRAEYVHADTFSNVNTHLDSESCCSQSRSSDGFRLGLAYFFH